jgi:hypothetical protein
MFQIVVEAKETPPEQGSFRIEVHFSREINVSPVVARRRAAGFVGTEILMAVRMGDPILIADEPPCWRVPFYFSLTGIDVAEAQAALGSIDVDAVTGEVIKPSVEQILAIRSQANEIVARYKRPTEATR